MNGYGMPVLSAVDCSGCGRPAVTSEISVRPDLCYPCFAGLAAAKTGEKD